MKTELEVHRELKAIRAYLVRLREEGEADDMAYGAQQALTWMLGTGMAPSGVLSVIDAVAAELDKGQGGA